MSADTVVPDLKNPQALNRYTYAYNNSLKYIDPSGHVACFGTNHFISETTNDGGISWASCWAEERDKGLLLLGGVANNTAEIIASAIDRFGFADGMITLQTLDNGCGGLNNVKLGSFDCENNTGNGEISGTALLAYAQKQKQEKKQNPGGCYGEATSPSSFGGEISSAHSITCGQLVNNLQLTGALVRITADGKYPLPTTLNVVCAYGQSTAGCGPEPNTAPKITGWWYATTTGTYEWQGQEYNVQPSPTMLWC